MWRCVASLLASRCSFLALRRQSVCSLSWAAQPTFAACHCVVQGHASPVADGLPFLRVSAAGGFLAIIYRTLGLPVGIGLHFVVNEPALRGALGPFVGPSNEIVLVGACIASLGIVATYRQRGPECDKRPGRAARRPSLGAVRHAHA